MSNFLELKNNYLIFGVLQKKLGKAMKNYDNLF